MKTLFGKKRSAKTFPKRSSLTLPSTFAQEVLNLEEQLNLNCTLPLVTRLISLYTKAIEHYEAEKNLKHIHYQERMQQLLSKTNVLQLFKSSSSPVPSPKSAPNTSPKHKFLVTELVYERNCEKVLKEHMEGNSDIFDKIQNNLKLQAESLSQRLTLRKKAQTPKYLKKFVFDENESGKDNPVEEFEREVEGILEKYVREKSKVKKQIKEKYQEYLSETGGIKGEVKEKLMQELVKNMNKEIEEAVLDADVRRNDEVASARQKLNKRI